jgi:transcription initiation factor TFIIIB Brf1 subunit/transcription initiation factor TFIIB
MSDKPLSALLLNAHLNSITNPRLKKQFLINCLQKQGFILSEPGEYTREELNEDTDICKMCNSSSLIFTNHEAICNNCGTVKDDNTINPFKTFKQELNSGRGTFIEAGTINITVMKDGKPVIRDLAKVNTWINTDPVEDKIKKGISYIIDTIDILESEYPPLIFEKVKQQILEMWYIIIINSQELRGEEKKALAVWSIYYPIVYNDLHISIQKLGRLFKIQIGDIKKKNWIMKNLFKNTKYEKYISVKVGSSIDLELDDFLNIKLERVKRNIKKREEVPLGDKQVYGIIYAIAQKESIKKPIYKKYTLKFMSEKTGLSKSIISTEAAKYSDYIK